MQEEDGSTPAAGPCVRAGAVRFLMAVPLGGPVRLRRAIVRPADRRTSVASGDSWGRPAGGRAGARRTGRRSRPLRGRRPVPGRPGSRTRRLLDSRLIQPAGSKSRRHALDPLAAGADAGRDLGLGQPATGGAGTGPAGLPAGTSTRCLRSRNARSPARSGEPPDHRRHAGSSRAIQAAGRFEINPMITDAGGSDARSPPPPGPWPSGDRGRRRPPHRCVSPGSHGVDDVGVAVLRDTSGPSCAPRAGRAGVRPAHLGEGSAPLVELPAPSLDPRGTCAPTPRGPRGCGTRASGGRHPRGSRGRASDPESSCPAAPMDLCRPKTMIITRGVPPPT